MTRAPPRRGGVAGELTSQVRRDRRVLSQTITPGGRLTGASRPALCTVVDQMQRSHSALGLIIQIVGLMLLLVILAGVLFAVFAVASLTSVPGRVGNQFGDAAYGAARAVGGAGEAIQRVADPNRPPTGMTYDTEY